MHTAPPFAAYNGVCDRIMLKISPFWKAFNFYFSLARSVASTPSFFLWFFFSPQKHFLLWMNHIRINRIKWLSFLSVHSCVGAQHHLRIENEMVWNFSRHCFETITFSTTIHTVREGISKMRRREAVCTKWKRKFIIYLMNAWISVLFALLLSFFLENLSKLKLYTWHKTRSLINGTACYTFSLDGYQYVNDVSIFVFCYIHNQHHKRNKSRT